MTSVPQQTPRICRQHSKAVLGLREPGHLDGVIRAVQHRVKEGMGQVGRFIRRCAALKEVVDMLGCAFDFEDDSAVPAEVGIVRTLGKAGGGAVLRHVDGHSGTVYPLGDAVHLAI